MLNLYELFPNFEVIFILIMGTDQKTIPMHVQNNWK